MNIDELTIGQLKQLQSLVGGAATQRDDSHWVVGCGYFIRTVTNYLVGELVKVTPDELVITKASWVAHTGRYHECIRSGAFDEVEPYLPEQHVVVGRGAIVDAVIWPHDLPSGQK